MFPKLYAVSVSRFNTFGLVFPKILVFNITRYFINNYRAQTLTQILVAIATDHALAIMPKNVAQALGYQNIATKHSYLSWTR